jgi:GT2 family glycosyltransferase
MTEVPRFSVIIATLRRPELLADTLASVLACDPRPAEILVIDGDPARSASGVVDRTTNVHIPVRYIAAPLGLTTQRNVGMAHASEDVVLFLDDDVLVPPETFRVLDEIYRDPTVIGATARVIGSRSRLVPAHSRLRRFLPGGGREGGFTRYGYPRYVQNVEKEFDVESMTGCFMSARRATAMEVGFDERLAGYALAEDEDFSYRLAQRGCIRYVPRIVVAHRLGPPHDGMAHRSMARTLVMHRKYLFRKNFPQTRLARIQFAGLVGLLAGHRLVLRDFEGVRGILEGTFDSLNAQPDDRAEEPEHAHS